MNNEEIGFMVYVWGRFYDLYGEMFSFGYVMAVQHVKIVFVAKMVASYCRSRLILSNMTLRHLGTAVSDDWNQLDTSSSAHAI